MLLDREAPVEAEVIVVGVVRDDVVVDAAEEGERLREERVGRAVDRRVDRDEHTIEQDDDERGREDAEEPAGVEHPERLLGALERIEEAHLGRERREQPHERERDDVPRDDEEEIDAPPRRPGDGRHDLLDGRRVNDEHHQDGDGAKALDLLELGHRRSRRSLNVTFRQARTWPRAPGEPLQLPRPCARRRRRRPRAVRRRRCRSRPRGPARSARALRAARPSR